MLGVDVEKAQERQPNDRDLGLGRGGFGFENSSKAEGCSSSKPRSPPFPLWSSSCPPSEQEAEGSRSIRRAFIRSHARPGSRSQ